MNIVMIYQILIPNFSKISENKMSEKEATPGFDVVFSILLGMLVICLCWFVYQYYHTKLKISLKCIIYGVLCCLFYMLAILFNIIYDIQNDYGKLTLISNILQIIFWHMGNIILYFYLLFRLRSGFMNTIYQIKQSTHIVLLVLVSIYLFFTVYLFVLGCIMVGIGERIFDKKSFLDAVLSTKIGTLTVDLFISTSLLVIFVHKLYDVGKSKHIDSKDKRDISMVPSRTQTTLNAPDTDGDIESPTLSAKTSKSIVKEELKHDRIFVAIGKVTLLSIIMLISNQITMIMSIVSWQYADDIKYPKFSKHSEDIYSMAKVLDAFITSLCIFLGFGFTQFWYNLCCGFCNDKIKGCFVDKMQNDMEKAIQNAQM